MNEKETEKVEEDVKGNMTDGTRREESVEGSVEKEHVSFRPKHATCDRNVKYSGKTGRKSEILFIC